MATSDKRAPGDMFAPPGADMWNAMVGAGEAFLESQLSTQPGGPIAGRSTDILLIKNGSGGDRSRGDVMGAFSKTLETLEPSDIRLTGAAPTSEGFVGVLIEPLPSGDIGRVQLSGVCLAKVNIGSTSHKYAYASPGSYVLTSGSSGSIQLIWTPGTTGVQECVVRLGSEPGTLRMMQFKLTGNWSSRIASADFWEMDDDVDTDQAVDSGNLHDRQGIFALLGIGDKGQCFRQDGKYYTDQAPCPT